MNEANTLEVSLLVSSSFSDFSKLKNIHFSSNVFQKGLPPSGLTSTQRNCGQLTASVSLWYTNIYTDQHQALGTAGALPPHKNSIHPLVKRESG